MKILVLSDSHSALRFMRSCVEIIKPDAVVHLGDHYDDGQVLAEEYRHLTVHQVPGNCDRYRCPPFAREVLCYTVCGVRLFMTHGHTHHVKMGTGALEADARRSGAQVVLYGHTHKAECRYEDGLWIINPGACGGWGGSVALVQIEAGQVSAQILRSGEGC